jgi:hypothetical protein
MRNSIRNNLKKQKVWREHGTCQSIYVCVCLITISIYFYANFRPKTLLGQFLNTYCNFVVKNHTIDYIPVFINDALPSFIWTFVLTVLLNQIWHTSTLTFKLCVRVIPLLLMLMWEVLQYLHILPGTYSLYDVISSCLAYVYANCMLNK